MKAVILAGGLGTRISEESEARPKPMIEIGSKPILWHLMKLLSAQNVNDFVICCGYRGYIIKEYFANYFLHMSDVTFDMQENGMTVHHRSVEPWKVTLVETGESTMTGGRLARVADYLDPDEPFLFTYGDGLADVDLAGLVAFHREQGLLATVTAIQPQGRYGSLVTEDDSVIAFEEKPAGDGAWVNGGFFVLSPKVIGLVTGDDCTWEQGPLESLAGDRQLAIYRHRGFWHAMDTLRDKRMLESLWASGNAPWKVW